MDHINDYGFRFISQQEKEELKEYDIIIHNFDSRRMSDIVIPAGGDGKEEEEEGMIPGVLKRIASSFRMDHLELNNNNNNNNSPGRRDILDSSPQHSPSKPFNTKPNHSTPTILFRKIQSIEEAIPEYSKIRRQWQVNSQLTQSLTHSQSQRHSFQ
jgi:hypothetical protein